MIQRLTLPQLESYIRTIDVAKYALERNYLDRSTQLSEYITRGIISLPRTRALLLENNTEQAAFKLIKELTWREYWQQTWRIRQDDIFDYIRPLNFEPRQGLPEAVLTATTGIEQLDVGIKQLYETGYIHNHLRLWIAGLICNIAKCDWKLGAAWMHSYLIDGDYASNHLSWQWVAGSYTGSDYLPQQENINTYTRSTQKNTYLDYPYNYLSDMDIPNQLKAIVTEPTLHQSLPLKNTITINEIQNAQSLFLYSPWTLDPQWRSNEQAVRVLIMPSEIFRDGAFSQNVTDSIAIFSSFIPDMELIYLDRDKLEALTNANMYRKNYPGIAHWPGIVDEPELLYPDVSNKFYPSFSSFWKQANK